MTEQFPWDQIHSVHIIGIGGAGMSAIARVLVGRGLVVRGSDRQESPVTEALRREGITVTIGHAAELVTGADLVLASSAVSDDNAEWKTAQALGIRVARRPDFLGALTAGYDVIAVAGAHGKTTVTAMIALILLDAGLDPSFIVGGTVADLQFNGRAGHGEYFVIEADEYRNTFLALQPQVAVVTNVEYDHPDCFPSPRHLRKAFGDFVSNIRPGGTLVACRDDAVAHALGASYHASGGRLVLYGQSEQAGVHWRATDIRPNEAGGVSFELLRAGQLLGTVALRIPAEFNASNALAALAVAELAGVERTQAQASLERYQGTARRFEVLGEAAGITVIDDYAHHPTQIRGVLRAARLRYPGRRLIAAWEPHTFSRVRALWSEFKGAFADADRVVILPIYAARETDDGTLSSATLAQGLEHPAAVAAPTLADATDLLVANAQAGDVIMMLGAGKEYVVGSQVVARLGAG